jgi:hypothetical protein
MHLLHSAAAGLITAFLLYIVYRKHSVFIWGFFSGFLPDLPFIFLTPFGVTNLSLLLFFSHTTGVFLFPLILVLIDIILIEFKFIKYLRPIKFILPKSLKTAIKIEKMIEKLQQYGLVPKPIRVKRVYLAGVIAGVIHLTINIIFGVVL